MKTNKLLAMLVVAAFALTTVPTTAAQDSTGFGTQVVSGDVDFRPTAVAAQTPIGILDSAAQRLVMIDFGVTGDVTDNCVYYHPSAAGSNIRNFDVRLTPCKGKAAGTFVGDDDTVEKSTAFFTYAGTTDSGVRFADVNNNGRYDSGDCVYAIVQTNAGVATNPPGLRASVGNNDFSIRLTPCKDKEAGTFVFSTDADFIAYGAAGATTLIVFATSGVAYFDADNSATLTGGDSVYFVPSSIGAGSLFPQFSIRLLGGPGAFGSHVTLGDSDFVPTADGSNVPISGGGFGTAGRIFSVDFGISGQVTDDCFYYRHSAVVTASPVNFDVRLTPCKGKAAGTLVTDDDTVEKSSTAATSPALTVKYADVNNNGRYDAGDAVYVGTGAAQVLIASTTSNGGPGAWTLRLTPVGSFEAGTLVFAGDADFTSYSGAVSQNGWAGFGVQFFDADNTNTVTTGDSVYFAPQATGVHVPFPNTAIRLVGGSGAFGSQMALGDADFVPRLTTNNALPLIAGDSLIDFGVALQVTDNCWYYNPVAPTTTLSNFDVRITPCQGQASGTMVTDTDTVEKSSTVIDASASNVNYGDVNHNGRYDAGDYVYWTTGGSTAVVASTTNTAWSIRLTPAGSFAAGTMVFAGDADHQSFATAASSTGAFTGAEVVAYFDADNSGGITHGDVVYQLPSTLPATGLVPLYSVRLSGEPTSSGPGNGGAPTPTATPTATPTSTPTATPTATPTSTPTSEPTATPTGEPTPSPTQNTPGFELVALVAALGAALVLARRK